MTRPFLPVFAILAVALGGCSSISDVTGSFGSPRPEADLASGERFVRAEPRPIRRIRPSAEAMEAPMADEAFAAPSEPKVFAEPSVRRTRIKPIAPLARTAEARAEEAPVIERAAEEQPAAEAPAPRKRLGFTAARDQINAYREAEGLPPLAMDDTLMRAAKAQSDAMAKKDAMDHSVGGSFAKRMARAGVEDVPAAENIAAGYASVSAVIRGWKASPAHDANLRMKEATRLGIAATPSQSNPEKLYWTLIVAGS
jgi:uncharacterized protein YkwD